jgi:enoyl-[acyl-carrier-protein] reductase (NADH)
MSLLAGRQVLVTGVLTERSLAFAVAAAIQRERGEVILSARPDAHRLVGRVSQRLPRAPIAVVPLDVADPDSRASAREQVTDEWGHLDGIVHSIAFVPPGALGGHFLDAAEGDVLATMQVSAISMRDLAHDFLELLKKAPTGAALVGFDFDAAVAWSDYDWQGVAKAALESINRYLAAHLGAFRVRANLVASGPLSTPAGIAVPNHEQYMRFWDSQAPLGWTDDARSAVADAAVFLLSDLSRAVTGTILHADGGVHAIRRPD